MRRKGPWVSAGLWPLLSRPLPPPCVTVQEGPGPRVQVTLAGALPCALAGALEPPHPPPPPPCARGGTTDGPLLKGGGFRGFQGQLHWRLHLTHKAVGGSYWPLEGWLQVVGGQAKA